MFFPLQKQKHVQLIDKVETFDVGSSASIEPQPVKAIGNKDAVSLSSEEGCESENEVQISIEERIGMSGGGKEHYIESVSSTTKATDSDLRAHVPFDEVALKQSGFLDCQCHHLTIGCEKHEDDKKLSDDNQQVNVVSIANVNVGSPQSNEKTMANLRDLFTKADNMVGKICKFYVVDDFGDY